MTATPRIPTQDQLLAIAAAYCVFCQWMVDAESVYAKGGIGQVQIDSVHEVARELKQYLSDCGIDNVP